MQEFADLLFSVACHQLPERTIQVGGVDIGLCHRCIGLHGGVFVAWLVGLTVVSKRARPLWPLAIAPLLLLFHWALEAYLGYASSATMGSSPVLPRAPVPGSSSDRMLHGEGVGT